MRLCSFKAGSCIVTAVLVLVLGIVIWQHSMAPEVNLPKLRAAIPKLPSSGLFILAHKKRFFEQNHLPVEIVYTKTGKEALESLTRDTADLAIGYETPVIQAIVEGHPIRVLTELHSSTRNTALVYRKDRFPTHDSSQPLNLRGKNIGVILGTNAEFFLSLYLMANAFEASSIHIVPEDWTKNVQDLKKGVTDAAIVWEPLTSELVASNPKLFGVQRSAFYTEVSTLSALSTTLEKYPESVEALMKALHQAHAYLQDNPEESQRMISTELGLPQNEFTKGLWSKIDLHMGLSSVLTVLFQVQGKWFAQRGYVVPEDFSQYYAPQYLLNAAPATVTYK